MQLDEKVAFITLCILTVQLEFFVCCKIQQRSGGKGKAKWEWETLALLNEVANRLSHL